MALKRSAEVIGRRAYSKDELRVPLVMLESRDVEVVGRRVEKTGSRRIEGRKRGGLKDSDGHAERLSRRRKLAMVVRSRRKDVVGEKERRGGHISDKETLWWSEAKPRPRELGS